MKIVKQGKLPEKRIWRGTCSHCKAVIEGEEGEMKEPYYDQRDNSWHCTMPCMCCGHSMVLYPKRTN